MTTTEIFQNGDGQAVRLPVGFQFADSKVAIRKEGDAVILEPIRTADWAEGFFERIRIKDPSFRRPEQGIVPPAPQIGPV